LRDVSISLDLVRFYSKATGKKADLEVPCVLGRVASVEDAAAHVHRDFAEHLEYARLFRKSHGHDGLMVRAEEFNNGATMTARDDVSGRK